MRKLFTLWLGMMMMIGCVLAQTNIMEVPLDQLKAMAYDRIVIIERATNELAQINLVIAEKQKLETATKLTEEEKVLVEKITEPEE